jgi:TfoX/Sxy family transcriptional regulator of competence genes
VAFNELLGERIANVLQKMGVSYKEKRMMGGLAFMVDDKMCVGVVKDNMMARIDPEIAQSALQKHGCKPMDFTGRPMKGFVFIEPGGTDMEDDLEYWVELALEFNPRAKSSKKKKK